jgi:hypothetical protein
MTRRLQALTILACLAVASAAAAQTAPPLRLSPYRPDVAAPSLPVKTAAARATPDLANPLDPLAPTVLQSKTMDSAVFAKTAVDRRFSRSEDVTGSLGFLCGLQPGHTEAGAASAYGTDPHGRFLGAKLSFAFR